MCNGVAQVDVFVHTYNLTVLSNNWSDERDQVLNVTEYQLLNPTKASVTFQEDFLQARECVLLPHTRVQHVLLMQAT
jgi:hypothetical protein